MSQAAADPLRPPAAAVQAVCTVLLAAVAAASWRRQSRARAARPAIVQTKDRGKVLVARRPHARGAEILRDKALMSAPSGELPLARLHGLSSWARKQLEALHCPGSLSKNMPEHGVRSLSAAVGERGEGLEAAMEEAGWSPAQAARQREEMWCLLRAWDANKVAFMGPEGVEQCVFPVICRMNHSCEPNVRLVPGREAAELVAIAAVDIAEGEELCICYSDRNVLPMLHFLHLPVERRRQLLLRWDFHCQCARCSAPEDLSRAFRCPVAGAGCPGRVHAARGAAGLGACSGCRAAAAPAAARRQLAEEAALSQEAEDGLGPLLRTVTKAEEFPLDEVLGLLGRCSESGLAPDHWLVFWLLCLAAVGGCGRNLSVAAQGVARTPVLPAFAGALAGLVSRATPSAAPVLAAAEAAAARGAARRPGLTPRLAAYFALG